MSLHHCGTCGNALCEYYIERIVSMSSTDAHGWKMMTPSVFTLKKGCEDWKP